MKTVAVFMLPLMVVLASLTTTKPPDSRMSIAAALAVSPEAAAVASVPFIPGCATDCEDDCDFLDHEATSAPLSGTWKPTASHSATHGCGGVMGSGDCWPVHLQCEPDEEEEQNPDELVALNGIVHATPAELRSIQASYPDRVVVRHDAAALQVIGCNGTILAQFPLSPEFMAAMED